MPHLVSPKWLLANEQKGYSLHFWKFVIIRSQKVLESLITPKDKNVIQFNRNYGVGFLDRTIRRPKPCDQVLLQKNRFNNLDRVNGLDEIRHNINSQWSFFKQIKSKYKPNILMLPSYLVSDKFEKLQQFSEANEHSKPLNSLRLDSSFNSVLENQENWADPGHLNRFGGILFTEKLSKIIGIEN